MSEENDLSGSFRGEDIRDQLPGLIARHDHLIRALKQTQVDALRSDLAQELRRVGGEIAELSATGGSRDSDDSEDYFGTATSTFAASGDLLADDQTTDQQAGDNQPANEKFGDVGIPEAVLDALLGDDHSPSRNHSFETAEPDESVHANETVGPEEAEDPSDATAGRHLAFPSSATLPPAADFLALEDAALRVEAAIQEFEAEELQDESSEPFFEKYFGDSQPTQYRVAQPPSALDDDLEELPTPFGSSHLSETTPEESTVHRLTFPHPIEEEPVDFEANDYESTDYESNDYESNDYESEHGDAAPHPGDTAFPEEAVFPEDTAFPDEPEVPEIELQGFDEPALAFSDGASKDLDDELFGFVVPSGMVLAVIGVCLAMISGLLWLDVGSESDTTVQAAQPGSPTSAVAAEDLDPAPTADSPASAAENIRRALDGLGHDMLVIDQRDGVIHVGGPVYSQAELDIATDVVRSASAGFPFDTSALMNMLGDETGETPQPDGSIDLARAKALQSELDRMLAGTPLIFDEGQAALTELHQRVLNNVALSVSVYPDARLTISSYTDELGDNLTNDGLSLARAESVRQYLIIRPRGRSKSPWMVREFAGLASKLSESNTWMRLIWMNNRVKQPSRTMTTCLMGRCIRRALLSTWPWCPQ